MVGAEASGASSLKELINDPRIVLNPADQIRVRDRKPKANPIGPGGGSASSGAQPNLAQRMECDVTRRFRFLLVNQARLWPPHSLAQKTKAAESAGVQGLRLIRRPPR